MMTPRGVADVQVYTPERVEARYGIRPDQIPDFIGLKGDTSDIHITAVGVAESGLEVAFLAFDNSEMDQQGRRHQHDQRPIRCKCYADAGNQQQASPTYIGFRT